MQNAWFVFVLMGVMAMDVPAVFADYRHIDLRSQDGVRVVIGYERREELATGPVRRVWAEGVQVRLSHPTWNQRAGAALPSTRVVLLEYCAGNEPQLVFECGAVADAGELLVLLPRFCSVRGEVAAQREYSLAAYPRLLVEVEVSGGGRQECRQELAFVVDGRWQVDPLNGTHQFRLRL